MLQVINPSTGTMIDQIEIDTKETIHHKWQKAKQAQSDWARSTMEHRIDCVMKFRKYLLDHRDRLALLLTEEVGKPITQSLNEINGTISRLDFFLEKTPIALASQMIYQDLGAGMKEEISREPLGVIANISAWNYPYFVGSNVFIPALLTGNAVIYKPSEIATLTGMALAEGLYESGVPKEIFSVIVGGGEVGQKLLQFKFDGIFFTGSHATGMKIAETAALQLTKVQLELGGKDPIYVCEDVNIPSAAEAIADGAFYNCGQSCCSVERIYVHEKVYETFVSHFEKAVASFVVGDPKDSKTYLGPLARAEQVSVLEHQIKDAVSKGAKLLSGGVRLTDASGNYFKPTILVDVNHTMAVMREESFGPLIGIQKVADDEIALELMNDTSYGLTAGIYTRSEKRARDLMQRLNAGSVYWNCCDRVSPRLPWSGRRNSGLGLTLGAEGILAFTQPKAWHLRSLSPN